MSVCFIPVQGIDCPREFTNTHLHRQLVMQLIKHKEFFLPILEERIAMNYGALRLSAKEYKEKCAAGTITEEEKRVYHEPGPFSFRTYLEHILDRTSWGEEITLVLLGMLFQVRITLVDTTNLRCTQVRHNNKLDDVDMSCSCLQMATIICWQVRESYSLGLSIGADHFLLSSCLITVVFCHMSKCLCLLCLQCIRKMMGKTSLWMY